MQTYFVRLADGERERAVEAYDPEHAAERWAPQVHADNDYVDELECVVRGPDGVETRYTVSAMPSVTFSARVTEDQ